MVRRIGRYYSRRIVNVNINIVLAGVLALGPTVLAVHLTHYFGVGNGPDLTRQEKFIIGAVTLVADISFDVVIYYILHWLANHWPNRWRTKNEPPEKPHLSYFRDATLVQFQRMLLSPILYTAWLGLQFMLIKGGMARELATVIGFALGIALTRTLHTLWMLRSEREATKRLVKGPARAATPGV